jgi:hypothetical protein
MMTLKDILSALPQLRDDELRQITLRIEVLLSGTRASAPLPRTWLFEALVVELTKRNLFVPKSRLGYEKVIRAYERREPDVLAHFEKLVPRMTRVEALQFGTMVVQALIVDVEEFAPVTFKSLVYNIKRAPDAVERAFPGYSYSNLIHLVLSTRRKKR